MANTAPEISSSDLDSIRLDQVISSLKAAGAFAQMDQSRLEQFVQGSQSTKLLSAANLYELYQENNFVGNLVDTLPDNACQKYAIATIDKWEGEGDNPVQAEINKAKCFINWCWKAARLQGWAAIILYVNDGQKDLSKPVNERSIRGITNYSVRAGGDQGEITVIQWENDQISPTYGEPIMFSVGGTPVHRSRLLLFYGVKRLSHSQYNSNSSQLGTSIVKRCYQEFRNFQLSNNAIASTMASFNQKILKIKDLAVVMASQKSFEQYITGMSLAMNVLGMLLVDAESGDFSIAGHQYGEVPELLNYYKGIFAGSTDLSHTELFGESPDGQTSGSYQEKQKAQYVHGRQESELLPELKKIARYVCLAEGIDPEDCTIEFPTLYELDAKDQAEVNLKQAQSMRTLVGAQGGQIVTEDEAAKALANGTDIGDQIDLEAREEMIGALRQEPEGFVPGEGEDPEDPEDLEDPAQDRKDDSTPVKKIIDFHGYKIGLQYQPFDKRHGKVLPIGYGHIQKTKGADGMAVDVYVGWDLSCDKIYAVRQFINGVFDEEKLFIGFNVKSTKEIEDLYKSIMPAEFFGGCYALTLSELAQYSTEVAA